MQAGIERVAVESHCGLDDYAAVASLAPLLSELRGEARLVQPKLANRAVWMLSSTAAGGGVAEMMPRLVALLCELGVDARWAILRAGSDFFALTKRLHNLIHGVGEAALGPADRALYESVSRRCAEVLAAMLSPGDLLVVHDPQPLAVGALVKLRVDVKLVWRCHIGHAHDSPQARAAWSFLRPFAEAYERAVFSAHDYIRDFLAGRSTVMHPSIDPLDHKNRELAPTKLVGVLASAGLLVPTHPVLTPPFAAQARRLRPDGTFVSPVGDHEIGLPFRPLVVQISRWDRLKGFDPLLDGFCRMKERAGRARNPRHRRRLEIARLVLAGPDPGGIQDDPEAHAVLSELSARYRALPRPLAEDVALVVLPMTSRKHNALMVNCLQRCGVLAVQNSRREGFSLTVTEAMWKGVATLGTRSTGIREQLRDGLDGRLLADPDDPDEIAEILDGMLAASRLRQEWGRNAHGRVYQEFLIFRQLRDWLRLLAHLGAK
jgi:trehalose synthase